MDTRRIKLLLLLIVCAVNYQRVDCATITASVNPSPAVVGSNNPHTVSCTFTLGTNEVFQQVVLSTSSQTDSIALLFGTSAPAWTNSGGAAEAWKQRGFLAGSSDQGFLNMVLNDTVCGDNNRKYQCQLQYSNTFEPSTTTVKVAAAPQAPSSMVVTPASQNATEFSMMTFECSGNVGRPAGFFQWFTFVGSGTSNRQNVTDQAVQDPDSPAPDGCTFTRSSKLTLNLSRTEAHERLVVRCRIDHPTLGNSDDLACTDPAVDFCRMSQEISVQYPVNVSVMNPSVTVVEGESTSLTCTTWGNPPAYLVEWRREGENNTLETQNTLKLNDLTLNDTGNYVCTAYNTIDGTVRNASISVSLTVDQTTTTSTTTPMSTTLGTTSTTPELPDKGGSGGDDSTVIIVVVVVVVVLLVVAGILIYIFIRRRNSRKEVEEPPEKPFNNNAGINTVAARPDLVRNDYNNSPLKTEDGLAYAELQFDNKPRSRRPLAIDDSHTDYSDVSMPQV